MQARTRFKLYSNVPRSICVSMSHRHTHSYRIHYIQPVGVECSVVRKPKTAELLTLNSRDATTTTTKRIGSAGKI